ncbi:MAG: acyl-ACP--UDP-N-acetylglucosamine O-acyltransferase [Planctomycetota bacterium]|jgi:UDP-N-acetylglucosamine acyltransferase
MGTHSDASVAADAQLGENVHVGQGCIIGPGVKIGAGSYLHPRVIVEGETSIGEDCEIFPYAVLGTKPQDKKLQPGQTGGPLVIGDRNVIREHVTIQGGTTFGSGVTMVGNNNMLLAGSHIGHDATVGNHVVFTNSAMAAGHSIVEDHVILGAMVGIHQFARVGTWAMVGAGSMLSLDAPPFSLVQGDRARLVAVNVIGMRRGGFSADQREVIKRVFRILFWDQGLKKDRIAHARKYAGADKMALEVIDFVENTKRGVLAPRARLRYRDETPLLEN